MPAALEARLLLRGSGCRFIPRALASRERSCERGERGTGWAIVGAGAAGWTRTTGGAGMGATGTEVIVGALGGGGM